MIALVVVDLGTIVEILVKTESFFATERERTESDSSEMSKCGGRGEIAGGQNNVRERCRNISLISESI